MYDLHRKPRPSGEALQAKSASPAPFCLNHSSPPESGESPARDSNSNGPAGLCESVRALPNQFTTAEQGTGVCEPESRVSLPSIRRRSNL
jgi:hypothetical protein